MAPTPPKFIPRPTWTNRLMLLACLTAFYMALAFCLDWVREQYADIPSGKWMTLFVGDGISVQLNMNTFDKVKNKEVFTAWVREDRQRPFSSGLVIGKTVLSKITVNCEENTVTLHEQRSFDDVLERLMTSEKEVMYATPDEVIVAVLHLTMCAPSGHQNSLPSSTRKEKDLTYVKFMQN
jgi:hypothetical protein